MRRIYKYVVGKVDHLKLTHNVSMPVNAEVIHVEQQGNELCIWALVNAEDINEPRRVFVMGTGWDVNDEMLNATNYVGTVQIAGFVWHIFVEVLG